MRTICAIRPSRLASPRVARPGCLGLSAVATLSFDVKELALTTTRHHFSTTPNNAVDPESSVDELVSFAKQTLGEHEPNAADSPELSLARTCLESAIDKGSMDAHVQLGLVYQDALGVVRNSEKAASLFETAASAGNAEACVLLASLITEQSRAATAVSPTISYERNSAPQPLDGIKVLRDDHSGQVMYVPVEAEVSSPKDRKEARKLIRRLVKDAKKEREACHDLRAAGSSCSHSPSADVPTPSASEAARWLQLACDQNHATALVLLGNMYRNGEGVVLDVDKAVELYSAAAELGQADALFNLGQLYFDGILLAKDVQRAIGYFEQAALLGDATSQFFVGYMLHAAEFVTRDVRRAVGLLESAAQQGHPKACTYLGLMYRSADGVEADRTQMMRYLDRAAYLEDADALFCLGDMHFHGSDGYEQDLALAFSEYSKAADLGSVDALLCVGAMLYHGVGTERDLRRAFDVYQRAGELGSFMAWRNLASMYEKGEGTVKCEQTAQYLHNLAETMEDVTT